MSQLKINEEVLKLLFSALIKNETIKIGSQMTEKKQIVNFDHTRTHIHTYTRTHERIHERTHRHTHVRSPFHSPLLELVRRGQKYSLNKALHNPSLGIVPYILFPVCSKIPRDGAYRLKNCVNSVLC